MGRDETFDNLGYEVRDGAAWITIQREQKRNALDRRTVEELARATRRAHAEPSVAVLVLSGAGERAFVAGADIAEMSALDAAGAQRYSRLLQAMLDGIERGGKPAIAAVRGFALGGGLELALACHLRIASDDSRFGQPEVGLGLIPGAGGTQRLPRTIGRGRALELILTGRTIDAAEALRIGLVHHVVAARELAAAVQETVGLLRTKGPLALARALDAVLGGADLGQSEAMELEAALFGLCFATADMTEGTRAFLEKRPPTFRGR